MLFWTLCGLLVVIALAFLLFPLFKKEEVKELSRDDQNISIAKQNLAKFKQQLASNEITQADFDQQKNQIENALALDLEHSTEAEYKYSGGWLAYVLILFIPIFSVFFYLDRGKPDLLDPQAKMQEMEALQTKNLDQMSPKEIIEVVKKRLIINPEDAEGWYVLGRTLMNAQKFEEAVVAYKRSYEILGDDSNIMLSLADAIAMSQGGSMKGEAQDLVEKAIKIEPNNAIGLWLAGLAAEQAGQAERAFELWNRLLPLLNNDPASANEVKTILSDLKLKNPDLPELNFEVIKTATLTLNITIDESIKDELKGNETVFIYAKALSGPPMPLAAKKLNVADLPASIILTDNDAVMPQLNLSSVSEVTVGARISMSGNPIAQAGDFYSEKSPVSLELLTNPIRIVIKGVK